MSNFAYPMDKKVGTKTIFKSIYMKNTSIFKTLAVAFVALLAVGCGSKPATEVGTKTDALADSAWESSQWISAVNAPSTAETLKVWRK